MDNDFVSLTIQEGIVDDIDDYMNNLERQQSHRYSSSSITGGSDGEVTVTVGVQGMVGIEDSIYLFLRSEIDRTKNKELMIY